MISIWKLLKIFLSTIKKPNIREIIQISEAFKHLSQCHLSTLHSSLANHVKTSLRI